MMFGLIQECCSGSPESQPSKAMIKLFPTAWRSFHFERIVECRGDLCSLTRLKLYRRWLSRLFRIEPKRRSRRRWACRVPLSAWIIDHAHIHQVRLYIVE